MKTGICLTLAALAIFLIPGCGGLLAPQPDRSSYFVLNAVNGGPGKAALATSAATQLSVGVGPVEIPSYLQRLGIATRVGPTQVRYSQFNRWAEPLEERVPRVLAQDLAASLPGSQVVLFPWPGNMPVDYQVQVDIRRFELTSGHRVVLVAHWMINDSRNGRMLASGIVSEHRASGPNTASATEALSQALAAMADTLASRLAHLAGAENQAD